MNDPAVVSVSHDGEIAVITVNNPPSNTISAAVRTQLIRLLDELRTQQGIKAAVLSCAGSTFISGPDINELSGPPQEEANRKVCASLEALTVPVVVAMRGNVMGDGLSIALSGHYRIAALGTQFGFPEVTLGILPGAGGTQRMPRLIGVEKTLEMVISAALVDTSKAHALGFLDEVIECDLLQGALVYTRRLITSGAKPRRTCDLSVDPSTATDEIIARLQQQARKQYPNRAAALKAIDVVRASVTKPFAEGLEYETEIVNECKHSIESKGLVYAFFAERETRRIPGLPAATKARPIRKAGIIGAGTMGGGIACCFANAGIPVIVIEATREGLDRGFKVIDGTYESMVKRGRLSPEDKAKCMGSITGSLEYSDLSDVDVIVEAVFESMPLKKQIFGRLDRVAKPGAVLATNTSTLDIDEIATATQRPGDVIGMHFFSPANVMPLLEVVRTKQTSPDTIRTVLDLSKPLRKTPVLAQVCYGFIGNRMMECYAREAELMTLEGATPRQIDSALEGWGMAMGILAVFDLAGIDVGVNVHKANAERYPPDPTYYQAGVALFEAGRLGQKNGTGYYKYVPGDRARHDDPEVLDILRARAAKLGVKLREHSKEEILERCLYPLLNEGFRILEEGVALRASDIDVVWTSGYGFPRYRGGPMFYAETIGLKTLLEGILNYQKIYGPMHWEPAPLLVELVRKGQSVAEWQISRG